jgi:hypothetical protein
LVLPAAIPLGLLLNEQILILAAIWYRKMITIIQPEQQTGYRAKHFYDISGNRDYYCVLLLTIPPAAFGIQPVYSVIPTTG